MRTLRVSVYQHRHLFYRLAVFATICALIGVWSTWHTPVMSKPPIPLRVPRNAWVDCGANCGNSWTYFSSAWPTLCPECRGTARDPSGFDAYLFEFNPLLYKQFLLPLEASDRRVHALWNAVWTDDNVNMTGYHGEQFVHDKCLGMKTYPDGAATMMKSMQGADLRHPFEVEAIDLSRWIDENFIEADFVAVKIDVEGAEWAILRKLLATGVLCRKVDWLAVELHDRLADESGFNFREQRTGSNFAWLLQLDGCPKLRQWE